MFDNARDAHQYLANTVCHWDGRPIWVTSVREDMQVIGYYLPVNNASINELIGLVSDPRFNCRQFNLGYMNSDSYSQAFYCSRRPARHVQQGLCDVNTSFIGEYDPDRAPFSVKKALKDPGFVAMLRGEHLTREQIRVRLANPTIKSVAISRFLAIKKHRQFHNLTFLEYKGREVSFSETQEFILPEEFNYLRETCQPTGVLRAA